MLALDQAPQWRKKAKNGVKCSLYTDVILFFFSFFTRTSASSRAKRARRARKKNKELFSIFFFPHHYPLALAVNKSPAVYITALAHLRPTLRPPWLVPLLFARPTKPLCFADYVTKFIDREGLENRQASSAALRVNSLEHSGGQQSASESVNDCRNSILMTFTSHHLLIG